MRLLFIGIGVIIILVSIIWMYNVWEFKNQAIFARGTVIELNAGGSHSEISFKAQDGQEISYPQNGMISGYKIGDEVSVLYDSSNPGNASINTISALWGFPILAFVMGIFFVIMSLAVQN